MVTSISRRQVKGINSAPVVCGFPIPSEILQSVATDAGHYTAVAHAADSLGQTFQNNRVRLATTLLSHQPYCQFGHIADAEIGEAIGSNEVYNRTFQLQSAPKSTSGYSLTLYNVLSITVSFPSLSIFIEQILQVVYEALRRPQCKPETWGFRLAIQSYDPFGTQLRPHALIPQLLKGGFQRLRVAQVPQPLRFTALQRKRMAQYLSDKRNRRNTLGRYKLNMSAIQETKKKKKNSEMLTLEFIKFWASPSFIALTSGHVRSGNPTDVLGHSDSSISEFISESGILGWIFGHSDISGFYDQSVPLISDETLDGLSEYQLGVENFELKRADDVSNPLRVIIDSHISPILENVTVAVASIWTKVSPNILYDNNWLAGFRRIVIDISTPLMSNAVELSIRSQISSQLDGEDILIWEISRNQIQRIGSRSRSLLLYLVWIFDRISLHSNGPTTDFCNDNPTELLQVVEKVVRLITSISDNFCFKLSFFSEIMIRRAFLSTWVLSVPSKGSTLLRISKSIEMGDPQLRKYKLATLVELTAVSLTGHQLFPTCHRDLILQGSVNVVKLIQIIQIFSQSVIERF